MLSPTFVEGSNVVSFFLSVCAVVGKYFLSWEQFPQGWEVGAQLVFVVKFFKY